ncbi:MAG: hypothetical protein Athens041674_466, partial [Parcubacteria group bacterium Athens0416_74]
MNDQGKSGKSQVSFHYGKALLKLSQTYVSLFEAVLEAVQNSIDSGAKHVGIVINRKERSITISDNGEGVSKAHFEEALSSVCDSVKERGKLGQFGLGLISPLGKCERFTFTSCARRGKEGYQEWTFDTDTVACQAKMVQIPFRTRALAFRPAGSTSGRAPQGTRFVDWRTRVVIHNYVVDREVSRIQSAEALKEAILEKYSIAMRRSDVAVSVRIINADGTQETAAGKAKKFSGKKLPDVTIGEKDAGNTIFRLYLARKGTFGYRGKVLIGEAGNDYRFAFGVFAKGATDFLSADVIELFKSGVFEGEILTSNAKLHENRKTFVRNDAYVGFCTVIEEWFIEHGKKHMKEVKEERQGQRIQDLSLRSLKNVESLLNSDAFKGLRKDTIESFKLGNVGAGHAAPDDDKVVGMQDNPSISVSATGKTRDTNGGGGHDNAEPDAEKPAHAPFTVAGPKGQHRTVVKGGSRGLQFDHVANRSDGPLWVIEPTHGTLLFNVE